MCKAAFTLPGQGSAGRLSLHGTMGGNGGISGVYGRLLGDLDADAYATGIRHWAYVRQLATSFIRRLMGATLFVDQRMLWL
jgi:hypothetical protein